MVAIALANYDVDRDAPGVPVILYGASGAALLTAGNPGVVDTELAAARLVADALALPTSPDVLATLLAVNTSTGLLDRLRISPTEHALVAAITAPESANQDAYTRTPGPTNDPGGAYRTLAVVPFRFNGTNWDRPRNNLEGTLLASAARTGTTSSADQTNHNSRGVRAHLNVTAVPGGDTITPAIEVKDPISGTYVALLTGAARATTGHVVLEVYPGITAVANLAVSEFLSRTWRVTVTHSAGMSFTYSVGYALIN